MHEHRRRGRFNFAWIAAIVIAGVFFGTVSDLPPPMALGAIATVMVALVVVLLSPFGRALAQRMTQGDPESVDPQLLEEVEDLRIRMAELEERLDFTERLLARSREQEPERLREET